MLILRYILRYYENVLKNNCFLVLKQKIADLIKFAVAPRMIRPPRAAVDLYNFCTHRKNR